MVAKSRMMGEMHELSVVIPTFNAEQTIEKLLIHLSRQSFPRGKYEIIVVDDGSTDSTVQIVEKFDEIRLVSQINSGPGVARMNGIAHATGEIILFLDSDVDVGSNLLEMHANFLNANTSVYASGGSVVEAKKSALFSWQLVDYLSSWFNAHPKIHYKAPPQYLPSLNFCVRKSVFSQHKLTWPDGKEYKGEDVIFCHKMRENNLPIRFLPNASVGHHDRATFSQYLQHMFDWGYHAPYVRGEISDLNYSYLFPGRVWLLAFTLPLIIFGYTFLIWKSWATSRFLAVTISLPQIFVGRIAYFCGVVKGTRYKAAHRARK
jgi:glycosyltransferase involved in cell wall biosynthesis